MDRKQAIQIQAHALDAADAVKKIEEIVLALGKEDRFYFGNHFAEVYEALDFGILKRVYERFPDLRQGREELAEVSSFLKWEDVALPPGTSVTNLDAAIFAAMDTRWLKVARVITHATRQCDAQGISVDFDVIGARIQALANAGQIEGQGNLAMWRHSEVRLPRS
jgi:Protein of unknown function